MGSKTAEEIKEMSRRSMLEITGTTDSDKNFAIMQALPEKPMSEEDIKSLYIIYKGFKCSLTMRRVFSLVMTTMSLAELMHRTQELVDDLNALYTKYRP